MNIEVSKINADVCRIAFEPIKRNQSIKLLLMSDLHFDSVYCDRKLLKSHLDWGVKNGYTILINGDLFDAMQAKSDRRGGIGALRAELNTNPQYFDNLVDTDVEFFKPYASNIAMIGLGNHETSVLKYYHTNLVERLVTILNLQTKEKGHSIAAMDTGGWVVIKSQRQTEKGSIISKFIHFDHRASGGSVNGGSTSMFRDNRRYPTADIIWSGHIHKFTSRVLGSFGLDQKLNQVTKYQHTIISPCYKEHSGWERDLKFDPYIKGCVRVEFTNTEHGIKTEVVPMVG